MELGRKPMYWGGALRHSDVYVPVISPATGKTVGEFAAGDAHDAERALLAAQDALPAWGGSSVSDRSAWMGSLREAVIEAESDLRRCITLEMGKPWEETQEDFSSLVDSLEFYAQEVRRYRPENLVDADGDYRHSLVYEPVGVVAAFLAWNFPLLNLGFKLGPALAAGCPIVIKPSPKAPLSAYAIGELCDAVGLPAGAVNVVCGEDRTMGAALATSPIPALVTLIGSAGTAKRLMEAGVTSVKRYSFELGGNAPVLVYPDADIDAAVDTVTAVKFTNAGQVCVAPNRVFVHERLLPDFVSKVAAVANSCVPSVTEAPTPGTRPVGPLIDEEAWQRVNEMVVDAVDQGAELVTGGGRPRSAPAGHFYQPTVLAGVTPAMRVYREEVFGPVVSIVPFGDGDDPIELANDTDTGLTAYLFTSDLDIAERCASKLRFGEIQINGVKHAIDLPHGGMGQSGYGYDCSHLAFHDYLTAKRVSRRVPSKGDL